MLGQGRASTARRSTAGPTLLYAGTADPWHEPMRTFAERSGASFVSVSDANHQGYSDKTMYWSWRP